ncbi:MutS protein msh5 [Entophlyctis sp. JEL0112]|nr:MutS protein msh5 [Entophlyctis sp. JEL0112]
MCRQDYLSLTQDCVMFEILYCESHSVLVNLRSLNIFSSEKHPNMFSSDTKEGLSLFGLLNLTRSPMGKSLMQRWFLAPRLEIDVIKGRQRAISLILSESQEIVNILGECVASIANISRIGQKLRQRLSVQDWEALLKFLFYALKIRTASGNIANGSNIPIFHKILNTFDPQILQDVGASINNVVSGHRTLKHLTEKFKVDFEESLASATGIVVKQGVDETLDEMKHAFDGLDDLLSSVAQNIANKIPSGFSDSLNVIYFPQLGYLITIPMQAHMTTRESFVIDGFDFQFCTAKTVFYKSAEMYEMDEKIGDLHSMICDKELEIVHELQEAIEPSIDLLIDVASTCAELDWFEMIRSQGYHFIHPFSLLAFAEAAQANNFVCPDVVADSGILVIEEGRHPLYERCMDNFVGNNVEFFRYNNTSGCSGDLSGSLVNSANTVCGSEDRRILLVTGPNFSGKTVYLKQVGLIVFMAHLGSFVPAKRALVGLTDKIITRIQAVESDTKVMIYN